MIFKLLLIFIVALPLMKTPYLPILAQRAQLSEIVFILLFFLWIKDLIKNKRLPQDPGLNKPLLIFIYFCLLSFFQSSDLFLSSIELMGLIYLFIMLTLVVNILDNKQKVDIAIKTWIGTLTVVLGLGFIGLCIAVITGERNLFCRIYHENFPYLNAIYRVQSTFRFPEALANYLIVSIGIVASEFLLTENRKYKVFLKIILFFTCLIMFATVTRDILAFLISCFLIYNHFCKVKNLKFRIVRFLSVEFLIILFLFIAIFCSSFYIRSYEVENLTKGTDREIVVNINYAHDVHLINKIAALEMAKRHPFLGVGLAMFPSYIEKLNNEDYFKNFAPIHHYGISPRYLDFSPPIDPHNDILQYFAETGILGGCAFVLFIATFLYLIFINMRRKLDNRYFEVRLFCFFASFIGVLISSIDMDVFKARHVWFLMALTSALITLHKNKD